MELYDAIQFQAMASIVNPDDDGYLRKIFRYYSRTYATSLSEVANLPIEDVLRTYFESTFESMDDADRAERIEWLLASPEERAKLDNSEKTLATKDDTFFDNLNAEITSGETIKRPNKQGNQPHIGKHETIPKQNLVNLIERAKARTAKLAGTCLPAPKPTKTPATLGELPEINMTFGPSSNLSNWNDLDPLAPPKKK